MSMYDYPDATEATILPATEEEHAERMAEEGRRIRYANGRYWDEPRRGIFEPVHWLARLGPQEARPPAACLGFRAVLHEGAAAVANGSLPIHLHGDVASYSRASLPSDARRYLARLERSEVRLVWLTDARLLRDQGYPLVLEWSARVGLPPAMPDEERYVARAESRLTDPSSLYLAAVLGDRLLGYMHARVIEDSAYLLESKIANEGLPYRLGSALDHAAMLVFQRHGGVTQVSAGLHQPELQSLTTYKVRHGFPVVHLPSRVLLRKPLELLMRRSNPLAYYRFTGTAPTA